MDYKKIAECVRLCGSTPKIHECQEKCSYYCGRDMSKCIPRMTSDAANAIEELLDTVEAMKHPQIKIQIDYEELTIKEVCDKIEWLKKERDKEVEKVHDLETENQRLIDMWRGATGRCSMCKHFRPVPQGCNLPNYKVCTDENDLWEPEPTIYKSQYDIYSNANSI